MPSRSNTPLHAAVLILVLLMVVSWIVTYMFVLSSNDYAQQAETAKNDLNARTTQYNNMNFAYRLVKRMVGAESPPEAEIQSMRNDLKSGDATLYGEVEAMEKEFDQTMNLYPAGHPDTKDYPKLPPILWQTINDLRDNGKTLRDTVTQLTTQKDQQEATLSARATSAEAARDRANAEKNRAAADHSAAVNELNNKLNALTDQLDTIGDDNQAKVEKLNEQIEAMTTQIQTLKQNNIALNDRIAELQATSFERPDGMITRVSQRTRDVWIDLGLADGLRRQQTFAIYDKNEADFENAKPKGSIEVTSVRDAKLAQARILTDEISNPILEGDIVFSPTWQPGRRLHFALAGLGQDARRVRNVITLNGGVIDAEVDEAGKRTGNITVETRYLVWGQKPTDTSDESILAAHTLLVTEAEKLGVERISVDKLYEMMGYQDRNRSTGLGRSGGGSTSGSEFRRRRPASAYDR